MSIRSMMIELNQRPVSYYPVYRKLTGRLTAGVLLSQILFHWSYWAKHEGRDKFHLTDAQLMEETGLTPDEFRLAKRTLKGLSFLEITREGVPAKTYYEINADALARAIRELDAGNPQSQIGEIPQTSYGVYQQTNKTETPSETPSENTHLSSKTLSTAGETQGTEERTAVAQEIERRRALSVEQKLRMRRDASLRTVSGAVLAPGTEEARLLWAKFVELTRLNGERSFKAWIDEQIRPELERLGPEIFRVALAEGVRRASSPTVRSAPAVIVSVLKEAAAPRAPTRPAEREEDLIDAYASVFRSLDEEAQDATGR